MQQPPTDPSRRVFMTADAAGGVWNFALELCEGLSTWGIEVILAMLGGPLTGAQVREAGRIHGLRLLPSNYKLEWMRNPWNDVKASGEWLFDLEGEFTPDMVHLNSYGHAALAWSAPVILTAHSCVASWWKAVKHELLPPDWNRYASTVKAALTAADYVTAPSMAMLGTLEENYGFAIGTSSSRVIPNGRSVMRFHRGEKEELILSASCGMRRKARILSLKRLVTSLGLFIWRATVAKRPARVGPARAVGCWASWRRKICSLLLSCIHLCVTCVL
jgi:glycogen(starch) synthase